MDGGIEVADPKKINVPAQQGIGRPTSEGPAERNNGTGVADPRGREKFSASGIEPKTIHVRSDSL